MKHASRRQWSWLISDVRQNTRFMFHPIPAAIEGRMHELEAIDRRDRGDGTARLKRLRQISPEVGRFIAILASTAPDGEFIEIGTSAGYSTLWLSLACRDTRRKITTFEILPEKAELARATFAAAGVEDVVEFVHADALDCVLRFESIAFCFLDAEKEIYERCYDAVIPKMRRGAILVADNAISHEAALRPWLNRVLADERVDAAVVPIGKGELVCRKR